MEKIVIIGAGPAGVSAALYAARANLDPLLIQNGIGALEKAEKIENYYGLEQPLSGKELFDRGINQAKELGVRILETEVLGVGGYDTFELHTSEGTIETQALILATGGKRKAPAIPGVKEMEGRGVSYCAICDAFFYRGKEVAVLGNSDFALHEAEELAPVVSKVTIFTNGLESEFSREHEIPVNTMRIQSIKGEELVEGIALATDVAAAQEGIPTDSLIPVSGVFVAIGTAGSADIARQLGAEVDEKGHIRINERCETTIPGLYAAGDCTGGLLQVCKAVYEGAQAGIHAGQYVRERAKKEG